MLNKSIYSIEKFFSRFPVKMFLQVILHISLILVVFGCIMDPIRVIGSKLGLLPVSVFSTKTAIFVEVNALIYSLIIYELRNIVDRIVEQKVFIINNVRSFKKVGIYILLIGITDIINNIISGSLRAVFVFDKNGSIRPDIFLFITLACICFVIAEIFEKAIQIKNDNDLTI